MVEVNMTVNATIVNRWGWVMKSCKHRRSKQRCQDLFWEVHDRANSFVLRLKTLHELRSRRRFLLVCSSVSSKHQLCFVHGEGHKREQKHTTTNFVRFRNHSLLLTIKRLPLWYVMFALLCVHVVVLYQPSGLRHQ